MSDVTSHYIVRAKRVAEVGLEGRTSQLHRRSAVAQRGGAQDKLNLFRGSPSKYRTHPRETSYENILCLK